jgi:hypothetical protein
VANTNRAFLEECQRIAGQGKIVTRPASGNRRESYEWAVYSDQARFLARELYPLLVCKHHEARIVHGIPSSGDEAREAWLSLKALHKGGSPSIDFPAPPSLYESGWYLRCDVIWSKPNPMPESVTDRPTKSHEYVFLLTKSERYWYDADAVREAGSMDSHGGGGSDPTRSHRLLTGGAQRGLDMATPQARPGRNLRSVWTINTQPWPEAHFATFPEKLVATCLLAGCPEKVCAECGEPWVRRVETSGGTVGKSWHPHEADAEVGMSQAHHHGGVGEAIDEHGERYARRDLGIFPACECGGATRPGLVIDPFLGSGTVGVVALKHGRDFAGCDLNPTYCAMAEKRIGHEREKAQLDFGEAAVAATKGRAEHV